MYCFNVFNVFILSCRSTSSHFLNNWSNFRLWTSHQAIAGLTQRHKQPFTLAFTHMANLELMVKLMCMFLDYERRPEFSDWTRADTEKTHKLHIEQPKLDSNPGHSCYKTLLTTSQKQQKINFQIYNIIFFSSPVTNSSEVDQSIFRRGQ